MQTKRTIDALYDLEFFRGELRRAIKKSEAQAPIFDGRLLANIEALKDIIAEMEAEGMR